MNVPFLIVTLVLIAVSAAMVLIILVQRPSGGGLSGAFGGAGAGGSETVFGGRVGDALTWSTVVIFVLYLTIAVSLNMMESEAQSSQTQPAGIRSTDGGGTGGTTQPQAPQGGTGQFTPFDGNPPSSLPPGGEQGSGGGGN